MFVEPASGVRFSTKSWSKLAQAVQEHRLGNGFPLLPGWEEELENEVCKNYGPETCRFVDETAGNAPRSIKISDVKNFVRVLGAWMASGGSYVDNSEAERRASICAACPKNQVIEGCTACANLPGLIASTLGRRATSRDAVLHGCAVCSCSNKAQVHIPLDILKKGVTDDMAFPSHCWKASLSEVNKL